MKKIITLALVGSGKWGKNCIRSIKNISSCKLKYISSPHIDTKNEISGRIIKIPDYRKLITYSEVDGIIIATPSSTHFEIASFFIKNKKNILLEKPITTNLKDALSLVRLVNKAKSLCMAGHIYNYNPGFDCFIKNIHRVGKIKIIQSFAGKTASEMRSCPSLLWEWGPHDISMCLKLLSTYPISVSCNKLSTENGTTIYALRLFFPENIMAYVTIGKSFYKKTRIFSAIGTTGSLMFNDYSTHKVTLYSQNNTKKMYITYKDTPPLTREISKFIQSIRNKSDPETTIQNALYVYKILDTAEKSAIQNGEALQLGKIPST